MNKSLATALLCGAIGLAGTALAQSSTAGSADSSAAGAASSDTSATGATHTGPGQIDSSDKSKTTKAAPKAKAPAKLKKSANASNKSSSYEASNNITASASTASEEKPDFLASVQDKSTPARGLKGMALKRVDQNERKITAELNRASASSTGNANASSQASLNTGSDQNIQ